MTNLVKGPRPDVTPPQLIAMVVAGIPILANLLRAFGVYDLSQDEQDALSNTLTWGSVFAGALIGGDAILRTGRNLRKGQVEAALVANDSAMTVDGSVINDVDVSGGTTYQPPPPPPAPINPATKLPGTPPQ